MNTRTHKQARRKDAIVVSFLLDLPTLARIDAICKASALTHKLPLTRSAWIKRAIARDLAHQARAAAHRKPKRAHARSVYRGLANRPFNDPNQE